MSILNKRIGQIYGDLLLVDNSNTGVDATTRIVKDGKGNSSSLQISNRQLKILPSADTTTNTAIYDVDGNLLFAVDSTNDIVKAGIGQHSVNTQYAHFGINGINLQWSGAAANTHYAVSFNSILPSDLVSLGTGTDPATSLTLGSNADDATACYWYIMDNITIDRVVFWQGADTATGDTTRAHIFQYDVVTTAGATSGDLSGGTLVAHGADISNSGNEQSYYQQLSIDSANIDAGKVLLFTFRSDSINSDYTINATIKYHLR